MRFLYLLLVIFALSAVWTIGSFVGPLLLLVVGHYLAEGWRRVSGLFRRQRG